MIFARIYALYCFYDWHCPFYALSRYITITQIDYNNEVAYNDY